jgi:glutamate 5-kinase
MRRIYMNSRKRHLKDVTRIVVKVGTSTLTHSTGLLNLKRIEKIVRQLADIHNQGIQVVLVTSGAIGAGMGKLGLKVRPKTMPEKQAAAAVGQGTLIHMYEKFFSEYGKTIAQILLTKEDIVDAERYSNARNTFSELLSQGVIPIVNENDAVVTDEIKVGDNDTLSAMVTGLIQADLLIILSDIDGLYDSNPRTNPNAKIIYNVAKITDEIKTCAEGAGSSLGTGGMETKIKAAEIVVAANACMIIAEGSKRNVINDILEGKEIGTLFEANTRDEEVL